MEYMLKSSVLLISLVWHSLSKSTYFRLQRVYLIPTVNEWWCWTRDQLLNELSGEDIVVGGDGQSDSPGFNAKNLCYLMVDVKTNYIIDIQILDKRQVGLVSTNMEREAARRGLENLRLNVKVVEFVTDASSSVKTLLGEYSKCKERFLNTVTTEQCLPHNSG